jgi:P-type conjugative transfer protein TrbL
MYESFSNFGGAVNSAFYFVLNKIISLQTFFLAEASVIGRVVLLIALLSTALNHALNGTGLKENIIKILKATLFFLIVVAVYPRIIGWITDYTYTLAYNSVGSSVKKYFDGKIDTMSIVVSENTSSGNGSTTFKPLSRDVFKATPELAKLFKEMQRKESPKVKNTTLTYTSIAPAAALNVILLLAHDAFEFADDENRTKVIGIKVPDFSRILKGLICGFFLILTGVFALLEYIVCLIEFMLVASVGVILFPFSIWEGTKFLTEGFIKAIIGFFMKLLLCNIAIFLLLYGFISMFHTLKEQKFTGSPDQFAFIIFTCILFFYICKSAPTVAQSLLTGSPSLNGAGAIGAVAGAVGAAAAVGGMAKGAVSNVVSKAGNSVIGGAAMIRSAKEELHKTSDPLKAAGAFFNTAGRQASRSLARSLTGGKSGNNTISDLIDQSK